MARKGKRAALATGAIALAVAAGTLIALLAFPFSLRHDISDILKAVRDRPASLNPSRTAPPSTDAEAAEGIVELLKDGKGGDDAFDADPSMGLAVRGHDLIATGNLPFHLRLRRTLRLLREP